MTEKLQEQCDCIIDIYNMTEKLLISILPKNHAGPVEKLISDFFKIKKKLAH